MVKAVAVVQHVLEEGDIVCSNIARHKDEDI